MRKRSALGVWPFLVVIGQMVSGWRAQRNYLALPEVCPTNRQDAPSHDAWPGISIIIPARNEEKNLPVLLASLIKQKYPLYEVLVVDDASTDSTADIVREYAALDARVRLLHSDGPPTGWTGKNHACWLGVEASSYPWLLFVDADVQLSPLALRSSLAFALAQDAKALSLFAQQRCETFWERLLLPFAYQQYFVAVNAQRVHSARGSALANGQYFLIERDVYQHSGGHAANAASIIDDVALATRLKETGITPLACRGEQLVSVRMYTTLSAIMRGFGKNSYLFLRQSPAAGLQTAFSTSLAASLLFLFVDALRQRSRSLFGLVSLAYLAQVVGIRVWERRFNVHSRYALLSPLAAITFLGIALNSMLRVLLGRPMAWKGRTYRSSQTKRVRYRFPRGWFMDMGRAILFKTPRSIVADAALFVQTLSREPLIEGVENIPQQGSFVLVANHYQRLDLWIGFSGAVIIDTLAKVREMEIHFITTDRVRIGRFTIPGTPWLIARVAAVWDLLLVTPPIIGKGQHTTEKSHYALLRTLRMFKQAHGRSICLGIMPEGDEGNARGLIDAVVGSGRSLYALSSKGFPLVPTGVWEEDGRWHLCFGKPFSLTAVPSDVATQQLDDWARTTVMQHIAAVLPVYLRGKFRGKTYGPLE